MYLRKIIRTKPSLSVVALISALVTNPALAQEDCTRLAPAAVAEVMHRAADELSGRVVHDEGNSVLADDLRTVPDIYLKKFDQLVPQAYRGAADWHSFRQSLTPPALDEFRIVSVQPRSGCRVSIVTGRFDVGDSDEYMPWFYTARLQSRDGRLVLTDFRLPSPVPRKRTGAGTTCLAEIPDPAVLADLRGRLLAALRSGDDGQIAALFSPTGAFAIFDPTFDERVRGFEQSELARQATAGFFRNAVIEDMPEEQRAVQLCSNLEFGGILDVTMPSGQHIPIGYRSYAFLKDDRDGLFLTHLFLTLLPADIALNLPEVTWDMLKEAETEIRGWMPAP